MCSNTSAQRRESPAAPSWDLLALGVGFSYSHLIFYSTLNRIHLYIIHIVWLLTFEERLAGTISWSLQIFYDAIVYVAMLNLVLLLAYIINDRLLFLLEIWILLVDVTKLGASLYQRHFDRLALISRLLFWVRCLTDSARCFRASHSLALRWVVC